MNIYEIDFRITALREEIKSLEESRKKKQNRIDNAAKLSVYEIDDKLRELSAEIVDLREKRKKLARKMVRQAEKDASAVFAFANSHPPDGEWWVHVGWNPYGRNFHWTAPSGPFTYRLLAEIKGSLSKGHRVLISSSSETPEVE